MENRHRINRRPSAGPPLRVPVEEKNGQLPALAERIGEGLLVPQLAPRARELLPPHELQLQQTRTSCSKPLRMPSPAPVLASRTTSWTAPLITLSGEPLRVTQISYPFERGAGNSQQAAASSQISRNASAGRKRAACSAGHTVARKQAATAKQPVSTNSVGRSCTGKREMKYTLGSRGKP
jgi:hypothetical protein